jgi:hypothetical protein
MRSACAAVFCLCAVVADAAGAADADGYAYAWPVRTQGDGAAWQVELTPEVYAAVTSADLRDVAVVNAAGNAVPTALYRPPAAAAHEALIDLPMFALPAAPAGAAPDAVRLQIERAPDGRLRSINADVQGTAAANADAKHDLLLDASAVREPLAALHVAWAADQGDASAQFAVDGSDDLQNWRILAARATVLRLTQNGNVLERHEIALNGARSAYLRVRRLDAGDELRQLRLRGRSSAASTPDHSARQWAAAVDDGADSKRLDATLPPGDGQHAVAWRYHLAAPLAADMLRVELADDNSLARVHVMSRQRPGDDPGAWLQRANFVAFRLHQGDGAIGNDDVAASAAARAQEWRIETATPLERAPKLSVAFTPDRFVFLAQGSGPFRLVAGSAKARRADYPVDAALASLRAAASPDWQPPLATLDGRTTLAGDNARIALPPERVIDWKTLLLWGVLVGAAALIGGLAVSLLRNRDQGSGAKGQ